MAEKGRNKVRTAIFASGAGSNAEALIHGSYRIGSLYSIVLVVSNNSRAGALALAAMYDIPRVHISAQTHPEHGAYVRAMLDALRGASVDMIALAGYMKRLPDEVIDAYRGRILNIHPALLPAYGGQGMYGLHVHEAVIRAGERETGVTIHEVEGEYDTGAILAQERIEVLPDDTAETLSHRVRLIEHALYPEVLQRRAERFLQL